MNDKLPPATLRCRIMGHRWAFAAEDDDVVWSCGRGCGEGGRRAYADPAEARRFAAAFSRGGPASVGPMFRIFAGQVRRPDADRRTEPDTR